MTTSGLSYHYISQYCPVYLEPSPETVFAGYSSHSSGIHSAAGRVTDSFLLRVLSAAKVSDEPTSPMTSIIVLLFFSTMASFPSNSIAEYSTVAVPSHRVAVELLNTATSPGARVPERKPVPMGEVFPSG